MRPAVACCPPRRRRRRRHSSRRARAPLDDAAGHNWLVVGTSRGYLALWDLRFSMWVRLWRHSCQSTIYSLKHVPVLTARSPAEPPRPQVLCCAGVNEASILNLHDGSCVQLFRVLPSSVTKSEATQPTTLTACPLSMLEEAATARLSDDALPELEPARTAASMRAVACPIPPRAPPPFLITAGTDRHIRYWNLQMGSQSYTMAGVEVGDQRPTYATTVERSTGIDMVLCQEASAASIATSAASHRRGPVSPSPFHDDCVNALALVKLPIRMLLSGSRDGVIKIWA
eukprot:PLAT9425.1.p1 GENE.PLAT9425.1~~PLAT9425.1.p1  ORF type:complete len:286 (+),score=108.93 PLAT9425.1:3-860(+)